MLKLKIKLKRKNQNLKNLEFSTKKLNILRKIVATLKTKSILAFTNIKKKHFNLLSMRFFSFIFFASQLITSQNAAQHCSHWRRELSSCRFSSPLAIVLSNLNRSTIHNIHSPAALFALCESHREI